MHYFRIFFQWKKATCIVNTSCCFFYIQSSPLSRLLTVRRNVRQCFILKWKSSDEWEETHRTEDGECILFSTKWPFLWESLWSWDSAIKQESFKVEKKIRSFNILQSSLKWIKMALHEHSIDTAYYRRGPCLDLCPVYAVVEKCKALQGPFEWKVLAIHRIGCCAVGCSWVMHLYFILGFLHIELLTVTSLLCEEPGAGFCLHITNNTMCLGFQLLHIFLVMCSTPLQSRRTLNSKALDYSP